MSASVPSATAVESADVVALRRHLRFYPDYPKPGVTFCDVLPILRDPLAFESLLNHLVSHVFVHTLPRLSNAPPTTPHPPAPSADGASLPPPPRIDAVVGLDARGFLLGPIMALRLGAAFVPVRKRGKLPGKCLQASYTKEYGEDIFEIPEASIAPNANVVVVDDLIATGGSAGAAGSLVRQLGARVVQYLFVVEIPFLAGAKKLDAPSYSMIQVD